MTVVLNDKAVGCCFPFAQGDGLRVAFDALKTSIPNLTASSPYVRTDWQGTSLLYSTARTNLLSNSLMIGGGGAPTDTSQPVATGTSTPGPSSLGGPGIAYTQTAVAQRPFFGHIAPPAVSANTTYCLSFLLEATDGVQANAMLGYGSFPAGAVISYPACSANPTGGAGGATVPGVLLCVLTVAGTAGIAGTRTGLGVNGGNTGTIRFSHPQFEVGSTRTGFIATPAGASATVTDYTLSNGVITLAQTQNPAVGQHANMARTNNWLQSTSLATAPNTISSLSLVQNAAIAPDGTNTGVKMVEAAASATHLLFQSITQVDGPVSQTFYLKAGERIYAAITPDAAANVFAFVDLTTGQVTNLTGAITLAVTAAPNGWWKCVATSTVAAGAKSARVYVCTASNSVAAYLGDGTSGIYVWHPQNEAGSVGTADIPTVASAVKVVDISPTGGNGNGGTATFELSPSGTTPTVTALYKTDWQGKQLLYSTARTNYAPQSQSFNLWTANTGLVVSADAISAPDFTTSADLLSATGGTVGYASAAMALASGTPIKLKAWVKNIDATQSALYVRTGIDGGRIQINWSGSTLVSVTPASGGSNGQFTAYPDGWYLVSVDLTTTELNQTIRVYPDILGTNKSVYVWGIQALSSDGSYIPTAASPVTVTDYSLTTNTATLSPAPAGPVGDQPAALITWDGSYVGGLGVGSILAKRMIDQYGKVV